MGSQEQTAAGLWVRGFLHYPLPPLCVSANTKKDFGDVDRAVGLECTFPG